MYLGCGAAGANCYGEGAAGVYSGRSGTAGAVDQRGRYVAVGAELGALKVSLAAWLWPGLLRHRDDGGGAGPLRPVPLRLRGLPFQPAPGRSDARGRYGLREDGAAPAPAVGADA